MTNPLANRPRALWDGGLGTMLGAAGALHGAPELLCAEQPELLRGIHEAYAAAGAMAVSTNSFGGTRVKLARHGLGARAAELTALSVRAAREGVGRIGSGTLVALSLGPTGELLRPLGPLPFEDAYAAYAEQARAAADAGADLCIIETMSDIAESRAAALAVREAGLPFLISYTFEGERMLMGGTPCTAALAAHALGAFAVGMNCSGGPEHMLRLLPAMGAASPLPVLVQPNAGLPQMVNGATVFPYAPDAMAPAMARLLELGAWGIGGCCGTTPAHIKAFSALLPNAAPAPAFDGATRVCSMRRCAALGDALAAAETVGGSLDALYDADPDASALLMDVRAVPADSLTALLDEAQQIVRAPLLFRAADAEQAALLLRRYHGVTAIDCPDASDALLAAYGAHRA